MRGIALALLLFLVLTASGYSRVPDDNLIVPGHRIGKWTLEMTLDDLVKMNGRPVQVQWPARDYASPDIWDHLWFSELLHVATLGRGGQKVIYLATESDEYRTAKGIGPWVGPHEGIGPRMSREVVEAAYGTPTAVTLARPANAIAPGSPEILTVIYDEIGFVAWLSTDRNGVVMSGVFRPGTAKSIWKY